MANLNESFIECPVDEFSCRQSCQLRFFSSSFQLNDNGFEDGEDNYSKGNSGLKTLNLRLEEVAHIRSALTKAELEGIHDGNLRRDIKCGKVC